MSLKEIQRAPIRSRVSRIDIRAFAFHVASRYLQEVWHIQVCLSWGR